MSHMIFIMLPKKSLTTQLLLTNPTALFLNDVWLLVFTVAVSLGDKVSLVNPELVLLPVLSRL